MPFLIDVNEIRQILPHRYPFLLVDRIVELSEDRIVGIKNVTANEPFFQGHFPDFPVMPGVLIVEAMAQVAGVPVQTVFIEASSHYLGKNWPMFRKPVFPLIYRVRLGRRFEVTDDVHAFITELEDYFRQEMTAAAPGRDRA